MLLLNALRTHLSTMIKLFTIIFRNRFCSVEALWWAVAGLTVFFYGFWQNAGTPKKVGDLGYFC
jgi:hypothetical protein